jgi:DNA invertase Pin-like site-specific DNA recombinase
MPRTRTPKRPAAYERISKYDATHATAQVPGIGRQAKANDAQARALGWPAPVHYADNESAYNPNKTRPDFDRLCEDLKSGAVDAVIVWDVDRLLRQVRTVVELIDIVEATGARFVSVSSGEYELDTANGRFAATILAAVAQKESDDKSRRLKAKHAQLAADGRSHGGRPPYGFADGMAHDPHQAEVVREIVAGVLRGESSTAIATELNRRGVPTSTGSGIWRANRVRQLAMSPTNAARRVHEGVEYPAVWEPIVSEADWRRVLRIFADPARARTRMPRRWALGTVMSCGRCGSRMVASTNGKGRPALYLCPPKNLGGCRGVGIDANNVEQAVAVAVADRFDSPAYTARLKRKPTAKAANTVASIERELDDLAALLAEGKLTKPRYDGAHARITERLDDARRQVGESVPVERASHRYVGRGGQLLADWPALTPDERRAIVGDVIERIEVGPAARPGPGFDPSRLATTWRA